MKAVSRTHIGKVRPSNQDALLIQPGEYGLFGVADGMGGHKAGDVASRMAVELVGEALSGKKPQANAFREAIQNANTRIFQAQLQDESLHGMGTTFTAVWEDQTKVLQGHGGDSRAYLLVTVDLSSVSPKRLAAFLERAEAFQEDGQRLWCSGPPFHAARTAARARREINLLGVLWLAVLLVITIISNTLSARSATVGPPGAVSGD